LPEIDDADGRHTHADERGNGMFYVYILQCADGSLYTGYTVNLEKRLRSHNQGKAAKYTRARLPAVLVYAETRPSRSEAMRREAEIKALSRAQKLELIERYRSGDHRQNRDMDSLQADNPHAESRLT